MAFEDPWTRLARRVGLETTYRDAWGTEREAPQETVQRVLGALGLGDDPVAAELRVRRRSEARLIEPVVIARTGAAAQAILALPATRHGDVTVELLLEDGTSERRQHDFNALSLVETIDLAGEKFDRRALDLPADLPLGYHTIAVTFEGARADSRLIVAPPKCFQPWCEDAEDDGRYWGMAVQLYALRTPRNWGIGDFSDLEDLVERAAALGADAVGVNPLHALFPDEPERVSPYSPSTRLYRNYLYLDVEAIDEFADCEEAQALVSSLDFQRELGRLRAMPLVDYAGVSAAKLRVLRLLFQHALVHGSKAFEAYRERHGSTLRRLATFEVLRATLSASDFSQRDWRGWPEPYRDPDSKETARFAADHADEVGFHEWLQFVIDEQAQRAGARARAEGMKLGLYADLAVGADAGGSEAWWNQQTVVSGLSIGAPPDNLSPQGQDWGLPLFNPVTLREQGLLPFVQMIRSAMLGAGVLRIDHVLGLIRLYCIPWGMKADQGLYVRYPVDELLAVIALESVRARCMVVGEDLGTLPPGVGETLRKAGILSYKVLYFEQDDAHFKNPRDWPEHALGCIGTHDLPPLGAFWRGEDIALRERLGLVDPETARRWQEDRSREREGLKALARSVEPELALSNEAPPARALYVALARGAPRLVMVQFEDLLPEAQQVNLPGTYDEHPNWRYKLPFDLAAMFADNRVLDVVQAVAAERGGPRRMPDEEVANPIAVPSATYRLQFNADFTFDDAIGILPYLAALGVTHVYASSYMSARAGSTHGYDVTDYGMINPEIGGEEGFGRFVAALRAEGLAQILDFVPNHMGVNKSGNVWWLDVLEWGPGSPFAGYFDIDWQSPHRLLHGKILLPLLGDQYGVMLESGELVLRFDSGSGGLAVWYHDHCFPLRPDSYAEILRDCDHAACADAVRAFDELPSAGSPIHRPEARLKAAQAKAALAQLAQSDEGARTGIEGACAAVSADPARLHTLLERQNYRLAAWRTAADEINYRRFFDINDLAGIRVEEPEVFEAVHRGLARLFAEDAIQGVRIDHIDGLADPAQYLRRLQEFAQRYRPHGPKDKPDTVPMWVEKILAQDEALRPTWKSAGTTGYEVATLLTRLHVDPAGEGPLTELWHQISSDVRGFDAIAREAKHQTMASVLSSELERLADQLDRLAKQSTRTRDFTVARLKLALAEIVASMEVYRTYIAERGARDEDRRRLNHAVAVAKHHWRGPDVTALDFAHRALTGDLAQDESYDAADVAALVQRFQQYTGPVMAKSVEDTAFYRDARLLALNEVGGDPSRFGATAADFHASNNVRARHWPQTLLGASTHDTKRGEDARARLATLSEFPDDWRAAVQDWMARTASWRGVAGPTDADAYFLFQTLIASWPDMPDPSYPDRLAGYIEKALREAKLGTSWIDPDEAYERDCLAFARRCATDAEFIAAFEPFLARTVALGRMNSLAQTVLRLTMPGVPDIYQGSELWNLSLADPDNRRPVDYSLRTRMLRDEAPAWTSEDLVSGRTKIAVLRGLLRLRRRHPNLFATGDYQPLSAHGEDADRIVGFTRSNPRRTLLVLAGRRMAPLLDQEWIDWRRAHAALKLPPGRLWREVLTGRHLGSRDEVGVASLLGTRPASVWIADA
jgi:(1->4)-alpha-D-glucan 1-alpha-D-glucosylmutase